MAIEKPARKTRAAELSAAVVCDSGARRIWTVNPDNDSVTAIDADSLAVMLELAVCRDPRSLARSASGELWIACHDDDRVVIIDEGGGFVAAIDTGYGSAPVGVAFVADGTTAYVSFEGSGELARFDAASHAETGRIAVGPTPHALAISAAGDEILVTRKLSPIDHAEVRTVDTAGFNVASTARLRKYGFSENADTTASGRGVANYLVGIAISPAGDSAWVASNKPNNENGLFFFNDLDQDNTVRNVVSQVDLTTDSVTHGIDLDNSDSASAITYTPLGDYLLVTLQGNNQLLVLDALRVDGSSGLGSTVTRIPTGLAPHGVCVDSVTNRTFVKNLMGRSLTVLETDSLFRAGNKSVSSTTVVTVGTEAMPPDVLLGKQIFYNAGDRRMSSEGYISCATCHLDGGHDGRVWDFNGRGEGFRNTTSLHGRGGTDHGNVHWSGNFDEIQDFENDMRGAFGGSGFMSDADFAATRATLGPPKAGLSTDLDALAAYVASLGIDSIPKSPYRNADGSMTAAAVTGQGVFAASGCDGCHAGVRFTDSTIGPETLHDVGTMRTSSGGRLGGPLPGIDTPTLLGVWETQPYFHDGSATTLDDVFRIAGGVVIQAEDGIISAPAHVIDMYVELNNDDTVHGRALVSLTGGVLTFADVDGGSGGLGALEIRYNTGWPETIDVTVNGVRRAVNAPAQPNDPQWRATIWDRLRVDDIDLNPGMTNTIEIANGGINIDDITVTNADDRALATPHRRVLGLAAPDRDALNAFLLQLDGRPDPEAGRCSDGIDNDGDGAMDCLDSDCAGSATCPGISVNRSIALTPRPTPAIATAYAPGCRLGSWTVCPDEWHTDPGPELRMPGEATAGVPALWLYQHSEGRVLSVTRAGDELVLSW